MSSFFREWENAPQKHASRWWLREESFTATFLLVLCNVVMSGVIFIVFYFKYTTYGLGRTKNEINLDIIVFGQLWYFLRSKNVLHIWHIFLEKLWFVILERVWTNELKVCQQYQIWLLIHFICEELKYYWKEEIFLNTVAHKLMIICQMKLLIKNWEKKWEFHISWAKKIKSNCVVRINSSSHGKCVLRKWKLL